MKKSSNQQVEQYRRARKHVLQKDWEFKALEKRIRKLPILRDSSGKLTSLGRQYLKYVRAGRIIKGMWSHESIDYHVFMGRFLEKARVRLKDLSEQESGWYKSLFLKHLSISLSSAADLLSMWRTFGLTLQKLRGISHNRLLILRRYAQEEMNSRSRDDVIEELLRQKTRIKRESVSDLQARLLQKRRTRSRMVSTNQVGGVRIERGKDGNSLTIKWQMTSDLSSLRFQKQLAERVERAIQDIDQS